MYIFYLFVYLHIYICIFLLSIYVSDRMLKYMWDRMLQFMWGYMSLYFPDRFQIESQNSCLKRCRTRCQIHVWILMAEIAGSKINCLLLARQVATSYYYCCFQMFFCLKRNPQTLLIWFQKAASTQYFAIMRIQYSIYM